MVPDPLSSASFYRYVSRRSKGGLFYFVSFSIYSNQGPSHQGSYQYTLTTKDNDTYSFVSIDMCPRPGPGRPFNFLGFMSRVLK